MQISLIFTQRMALSLSSSPSQLTFLNLKKTQFNPLKTHIKHLICIKNPSQKLKLSQNKALIFTNSTHFNSSTCCPVRSSLDGSFETVKDEEILGFFKEPKPVKVVFWVLFWASVSLALFSVSGDANAAAAATTDSIRASSFGFKIANSLRGLGWPDEAVVFALATLPVIELRGAIPVGYWLQLKPAILTILSILGNMVPVPFIILYLKPFASFLAGTNKSASRLLEILFKRAKKKASPVEEFQWLGLMLFVAVPFPGTGAWTGAFIASILDMPFLHAFTANFCGVVIAGLLMNLLVNLGLKYAILTGIVLFFISTFMWSILRNLRKTLSSSSS